MSLPRSAVFLDRDGTLIEDMRYPRDSSQVRLLPGAAEALRQLKEAGFALIVVSNQSGLGRGLITPEEAAAVHARFVGLLAEAGVTLDACYYCPHAPEAGCDCRKPKPGLLLRAAVEHGLDLPTSVMVGDKLSDVDAGNAAGCRSILFAFFCSTRPPLPAGCVVKSSWREVVSAVLVWA